MSGVTAARKCFFLNSFTKPQLWHFVLLQYELVMTQTIATIEAFSCWHWWSMSTIYHKMDAHLLPVIEGKPHEPYVTVGKVKLVDVRHSGSVGRWWLGSQWLKLSSATAGFPQHNAILTRLTKQNHKPIQRQTCTKARKWVNPLTPTVAIWVQV